MRVTRRLEFVAPFVLVVACKKPIAEPVEPEEQLPTEPAVMPQPPPDAALPIDAPDQTAFDSSCADPRAKPCNAAPAPSSERTMNPPRPLRLRVVRVDVQGDATLMTLDGGSERGISKDWTGCLVQTTSDSCLPGGEIAIIRVDKRTMTVKVKVTDDPIQGSRMVRVWPR